MVRFCGNCGKRLNGSERFCGGCGKALDCTISNLLTLPPGMSFNENGAICWTIHADNLLYDFWMDDKKIGFRSEPEVNDTSAKGAFNVFVLGGLSMIADSIVMNSDSYSGQDLPWDPQYDERRVSFGYSDIKWIRPDKAKNRIKLQQGCSKFDFIKHVLVDRGT